MEQERKRYSLQISSPMNSKLQQGCNMLEVSKNSLVIFLMCASYDKLCGKTEPECKQLLEDTLVEYRRKLEKSKQNREDYQEKKKCNAEKVRLDTDIMNTDSDRQEAVSKKDKVKQCKSPKSEIDLSLSVGDFVTNYIEELKEKFGYAQYEVILALIEMSLPLIDKSLANYKDMGVLLAEHRYTYRKDKIYFLRELGISRPDFARLSEAIVLSELFSNSNGEMQNLSGYGYCRYWVDKDEDEIEKRVKQEKERDAKKKEESRERSQIIRNILMTMEEIEKTDKNKFQNYKKSRLVKSVLNEIEKEERKKRQVLVERKFSEGKRPYKKRQTKNKK